MKTKTNLMIICLLTILMGSASIKTTAQIVFTDITDTTIYVPQVGNLDSTNFYNVDIDNNGTHDYKFAAGKIYNYNGGHPITGDVIGFGQLFYDNIDRVCGGCEGNIQSFLSEGDTINNRNFWYYFGRIYFTQSDVPWDQCTSVPNNDFFFGLKLVISSDTLYGWVRCSATDSSVTIKDYAFNSVPDNYILAGQTVAGINSSLLATYFQIVVANGSVTVDISGITQISGTIQILSLSGQIIKNSAIISSHNTISLNGMSNGIYIVRVVTPEIVYNKKMFLQTN